MEFSDPVTTGEISSLDEVVNGRGEILTDGVIRQSNRIMLFKSTKEIYQLTGNITVREIWDVLAYQPDQGVGTGYCVRLYFGPLNMVESFGIDRDMGEVFDPTPLINQQKSDNNINGIYGG